MEAVEAEEEEGEEESEENKVVIQERASRVWGVIVRIGCVRIRRGRGCG
jgi:hypothetical protein